MDLLTFHLGDREFAVDLHRVVEIISPPPITRVPDMPPVVRGLIGLRGEPTAVLDGGVRLTGRRVEVSARSPIVILSASQDDRELRYGVLVDAAGRKASVDTLLPWSASQENVTDDDACVGFAEVEGALVLVLDVDALLELRSARSADGAPANRSGVLPAMPSPGDGAPASAPTSRVQPASGESPTAGSSPSSQPPSPPAARPVVHAAPEPHPRTSTPPASSARDSNRTHGKVAAPWEPGAAARATLPGGATAPRAAPIAAPPSGPPVPSVPPAPRHEPLPPPRPSAGARPPGVMQVRPAAVPPAPAQLAPRWEANPTPPPVESAEPRKSGVALMGWIAATAAILLAIALLALTGGRHDGREAPAPRSAVQVARAELPGPLTEPASSSSRVASVEAPPPSPPAPDPAPPPPIGDPPRSAPVEPAPASRFSPPPSPAPEPGRRRPLPPSMVVRADTPACEVHEVRKGDTLWWISARKLGDPYRWPELFGENKELIADPDVIEVHDQIRIPGACDPRR